MRNEIIMKLNNLLKELNLNFIYTIYKDKMKMIIFLEDK